MSVIFVYFLRFWEKGPTRTMFSLRKIKNKMQLLGFSGKISPVQSEFVNLASLCFTEHNRKKRVYFFVHRFELDLLDRLAGDIVVKIAHKTVEDQIRDVCGTVFDVSHLPTLKNVKNIKLIKIITFYFWE